MKVLGVNGGNGVVLHPFKKYLIGNVELRPVFKTPNDVQWGLNFDAALYQRLPSRNTPVDVIVGAPDCGHSSVLSYSRAKRLSDPRDNKSLSLYLQSLKRFKPKLFLMENLPQLLVSVPQLERFLRIKYELLVYNKPVTFWGNSQKSRKRLVIVGIRKDQDVSAVRNLASNSEKLLQKLSLQTSDQLISGLEYPDLGLAHVREPYSYRVPLYIDGKRSITTLEAKEIWMGRFSNKSRWQVDLPRMQYQPGVYLNLAGSYPKTVRKQNRQFNHEGDMLTPREMARIQGIPDEFNIWYNEDTPLYCINKGRATVTKSPPYEIGAWFSKIMEQL